MPLWSYLERGGLRADVCAHRRWGKDDMCLHYACTAAHKRIGTYWHMLPEASQARKAIWDAINPKTGMRRINEAFPLELRTRTQEQEMMIHLKCGSTWQVLGSDNYNSLVGTPPIGVTFSEWSLAKSNAWSYIRPILLENGGFALFIWTPRGRNHATRAFEARCKDINWFTQRVPAARPTDPADPFCKTFEALTPVFTADQLEQELQEIIDEAGSEEEGHAIFSSEYLVDFDAPVPGSYYGTAIKNLITAGRLTKVAYDPAFKVSTAWDLGIDDYTSIWFFQRVQQDRINFFQYYEANGIGFEDERGGGIIFEAFAPFRRQGMKFDMHYLPHDVQVRELGAGGRSRRETLMGLGVRPIRIGVGRTDEEKVAAARKLLPYSWFDAENCDVGVDHLKQYRKKWNQSLGVFGGPVHDEHSHAADSFAEAGVNAKLPKGGKPVNDNAPAIIQPSRSWTWGKKVAAPQRGWKVM